ncbi:MAG: hypothetical protein AB1427_05670 [Thermodesulfobacteriota bacterium]
MNSAEKSIDYLISRSGFVGRQLLKLARWLLMNNGTAVKSSHGLTGFWQQQIRHNRLRIIRALSGFMIVFYTYYIGGSLTRSDQQTFAKLNGMDGNAYRLTLYNACFCGIPTAMGYFLLGEGFSLLKGLHSLAELPSLIAQQTSLGMGILSLAVDIFRMIDSAWHRRCWAPLGMFPLLINLPTYLKLIWTRVASSAKASPPWYRERKSNGQE